MSDNDRRTRLIELRDLLAEAIRTAEPNMLPQLAGQYRACLADLDALPAAVEETDVQKLRRKAKERNGLRAV